jgi:solute carrier family 25 folate transporter 32
LTSSSSVQQQLQQQQSKTKKQQQVVKPPYRGLLHAAYTIIKEEGILALYKGSIPALMLVSHGGIQFVSYEFLKGHFANFVNEMKSNNDGDGGGGGVSKKKEQQQQYWNKKGTKTTTSIGERLRDSLGYLVMGAASKFIASTTTYPLQVIKARLQQRSQTIEFSEATGEIIVVKREYSGVVDCIGKIWRNEGILGFFKGCVTNALRVAPSAAITFVTYEFVLDLLTGEESK